MCKENSCSVCEGTCQCTSHHKNINRIENNPTNTNTFHQTIYVQPFLSHQLLIGRDITMTSGPLIRNVNTDVILVSVLNCSNTPQTVTVSIINRENTTGEIEFEKFAFMGGDLILEDGEPAKFQNTPKEKGLIMLPPADVNGILTPFTVTVPAKTLLTVQVHPINQTSTTISCYEVIVTYSPNSTHMIGPVPSISPVIVNTWGLSAAGIIQEGNTVLHQQFTVIPEDLS